MEAWDDGRPLSLANPDALDLFKDLAELQTSGSLFIAIWRP